MEELQLVKYKDKLGVVMIPKRQYNTPIIINGITQYATHYTLNNVMFEDGSTRMCMDEELEIVEEDNDRAEKSDK